MKNMHNIKVLFERVPSISTRAYVVGGSYEAEAVSQSHSCTMSYFKGGVESWRVARPGEGSAGGLGSVPRAPHSSDHTASAPGLNPDADLWHRGLPSNQQWGPPRWWHRTTSTYRKFNTLIKSRMFYMIFTEIYKTITIRIWSKFCCRRC